LKQKQAWQLFVQEKGMGTQKGRSIACGVFMAVFQIKRQLLLETGLVTVRKPKSVSGFGADIDLTEPPIA
jgi:hypothetical protein